LCIWDQIEKTSGNREQWREVGGNFFEGAMGSDSSAALSTGSVHSRGWRTLGEMRQLELVVFFFFFELLGFKLGATP
jgi:hypothetical protein